MAKSNILLIMCDTFRCDALKCMGNDRAHSPNIDKLAEEGVLCKESYSVAPVCGPARSSLVTGVYPHVHQATENGITRRDAMPKITDHLKRVGYRNIMVGISDFGPKMESFDVYDDIGHKSSACGDSYQAYIEKKGYSRVSFHNNPIPKELFIDAYIADRTMEEIDRSVEVGKPFFAMCSMPSPHAPVDPPGEYKTLYKEAVSALNFVEGDSEKHPKQLQEILGLTDEEKMIVYGGKDKSPYAKYNEAQGVVMNKEDLARIEVFKRLYYGSCAYCDEQVGRLVRHIDELGIREDTLIIFTSDHGQQYYDHGFNDKHNFYDASWRVPLIFSMPGKIPPRVEENFLSTVDVSATILGAAGIESEYIQGYNMFHRLQLGEASPRLCATGTLYKHSALVTKDYKVQYFFEDQEAWLFDRKRDPLERCNCMNSPEYQAIGQKLLMALLAWNSDIGDIHYLKTHSRKGGPVATRVRAKIEVSTALDAENRLNALIAKGR